MAGTVKALWVGPYEAIAPDGTLLVPGETVYELTAGEAEQSANWQPVEKPASRKKAADGGGEG